MTLLVQTERILQNYRILKKQAGNTPVIPLLEANAYGLGDVAVARLLAAEGVGLIAVSRLEEAVRISEEIRGLDIMLLTPYADEEDVATILKHDIIGAVGSNDSAVLYSSLSRKMRCRARVQLCFDFGMGRFGFTLQDAAKAAQTIKHLENVELAGVYTVLPASAKPKPAVQEQQYKDFQKVITAIEREGLRAGIIHMADSAQAAQCPRMRLGAVRLGADLFGRGAQGDKHGLRPVGRCVSQVCDIKWLAAGSTVGDDARCRVRRATRVAIVSAGAADGLFVDPPKRMSLFKKAYLCEINGKKLPVIGRSGLTALTVDVTTADCAPGDIVSFDVDPLHISALNRRDYV